MKLSILIPTYNRCEKLRICINSAVEFMSKSRHEVEIIVRDNVSTDETNEYLKNASAKDSRIKSSRRDIFIPSGHENLVRWFTEIEDTSDWYWILGDDDVLTTENIELFDRLLDMADIDYIHIPTPKLILNDNLIIDKISGISDYFGLLEIFSFFSNQIISKSALSSIKYWLNAHGKSLNFEYCFIHALVLSCALHDKKGAISNFSFVNYQNGTPSENSGVPWFDTAQNIKLLSDQKIINIPLKKEFFLSRGVFIWRLFTQWLIRYALENNTQPDELLHKKIIDTINLISDQDLKRSDTELVRIAINNLRLANSGICNEEANNHMRNQAIDIYNLFTEPHKRI